MANVPFFFEGERKVFFGSAASRTDAFAVENPGAYYQEIGGNLYESNGSTWNPKRISGAALVTTTGASGIAVDRKLAVTTDFTVGTRKTEDFGAAGIKAVMVTVVGGTADSKFIFGETDTGVVDAMFLVVAGSGVNTPYKNIAPGQEPERRLFVFSERIRYVHFIAGTGATSVELLGV